MLRWLCLHQRSVPGDVFTVGKGMPRLWDSGLSHSYKDGGTCARAFCRSSSLGQRDWRNSTASVGWQEWHLSHMAYTSVSG
jgi:hypothetical protein